MANSGSMVIYHRLIKPFVKKNEGTIEQIIDEGTQLTRDAVAKGEGRVTAHGRGWGHGPWQRAGTGSLPLAEGGVTTPGRGWLWLALCGMTGVQR